MESVPVKPYARCLSNCLCTITGPMIKQQFQNIYKIGLIKDLKGVKEYTRNYSLVDRDITCNI
jgi:hypothetical protein